MGQLLYRLALLSRGRVKREEGLQVSRKKRSQKWHLKTKENMKT